MSRSVPLNVDGTHGVLRLVIALAFAATLLAGTAAARDTGFLNRSVSVGGVLYRYQVYVPRDWTKQRQWPVILSLHGAGERGDDGFFSTEIGLAKGIRRKAANYPFVAVFPQCRENVTWADKAMQEMAIAALEATIKEFNGDRARISLTGISMGGFGVWEMAMRYRGTWAALVTVCGGIKPLAAYPYIHSEQVDVNGPDPYAAAAKRLGTVRVWIFHGARDLTVPVEESRRMAEALKAGGASVRYTEYPDVGHNAWDRAYLEPELPLWLLAQRKK
jgi:predicted peptidase